MWREYNNNPKGHRVGDCAVRAVSVALGVDWDTAYAMLAAEGFERKDMPSSDAVWGSLLLRNGFVREACPDCRDGGHVAAADNGVLFDSWDSENEIPIYYYYREA